MKKWLTILALALTLGVILAATVWANGGGLGLARSWIGAGGALEVPSGDGIYTLSGAIGQAVVGITGELHTEINSGFWQDDVQHSMLYLPLTLK